MASEQQHATDCAGTAQQAVASHSVCQAAAPPLHATRCSRARALQVHDGAPATLAELAEVEEDLTAGAMQVR